MNVGPFTRLLSVEFMSTLQPNRLPAIKDVIQSYETVKKYACHTPVLTSRGVNAMLHADLYLKCENFQRGGAFKFRGASNAVFNLTQEEAKRGVTTHSSGNHAAGLALAASIRGIPAYIVMPENAPAIKKKAVAGYGGKITFCKPTQKDREDTLNQVQNRTGAMFIHAYNNFNVICGQGTASLELLGAHPDLDVMIAPVGGGGLLSGTLTYLRAPSSSQKVNQATSLKPSTLFKSILSVMNFLRIDFGEASERNSGKVFRSAIAVICSEGATPMRMVLNQEPKEENTSCGNDTDRYCKSPWAIRPVWTNRW